MQDWGHWESSGTNPPPPPRPALRGGPAGTRQTRPHQWHPWDEARHQHITTCPRFSDTPSGSQPASTGRRLLGCKIRRFGGPRVPSPHGPAHPNQATAQISVPAEALPLMSLISLSPAEFRGN